MSSRLDRCSPESEDSTSASSGPVCKLCGSASRTITADESSLDIGPESRVIPTCAPLWPTPNAGDMSAVALPEGMKMTARRAERPNGDKQQMGLARMVRMATERDWCPCRCHTSMSSAAASPVRTSASPAEEPGSTESGRVFGPSSLDSLASFDPATSSWRTSQLSLLEEWDEFSETWPRSGMTRSGIAYRRQPLAPLIGGIAFGSLPTPSATSYGYNQQDSPGAAVRPSLETMARKGLWPTLTASEGTGPGHSTKGGKNLRTVVAEQTQTWPTPRNCSAMAATITEEAVEKAPDRFPNLETVVATREPKAAGGSLNPTWVEWLMGFPLGWTDLAPSETPSSLKSQSGSDAESSRQSDRLTSESG